MSLPNAYDMARVLGGRATGPNQLSAPGPNNKDRKNDTSMSVTIGNEFSGGWTVFPHSPKNTWQECRDYVIQKMGWEPWKPDPNFKRSGPIEKRRPKPKLVHKAKPVHDGPVTEVCEYIYRDRDGDPYRSVVRMSDKSFVQFRYEPEGRFSGVKGLKVIPYRLPEIIENPHAPIWLVEGEKDADRLASYGLIATTAPMGAGNFPKVDPSTDEFAGWFDGTVVYAIPDNDEPGKVWTDRVLARIPHAQIVTLPHLEESEDVSDWLDAGYTIEQLFAVATGETEIEPNSGSVLTASPFEWIDPNLIPRREWLYGRHLIRKYVSTTISPGGLGKSSLLIVEALAMTTGRTLLGDKVHGKPLTVWYWNGEDDNEETQRRTVAAAVHHGIKPEDFASRLYTDTGREKEIMIASVVSGQIEVNQPLLDELEAEIIRRGVDVLIIDPFVASHGVGENDNMGINAVIRALAKIAGRCGCAIEIVHHVRKPSSGSSAQTDVNDARGASALIGGVRSARVLNVMTQEDAVLYNVENRFAYFRVDNGKANLAPKSDKAQWRHIVSVDLENGGQNIADSDHVGVVTEYVVPSEFASIPDNAALVAQDIADRNIHGRHDKRSGDWFGHLISEAMGVDSVDKSGARKLEKLIQTWVQTGVLKVENRKDAQSKMRAYIVSGMPAPAYHEPEYVDVDDCPF